MTVPPISGSGGSSSGTSQSLDQLAGNFHNFLTLLTTQLQNQDPLSPMDSTQFTQQLVAFTGVEQQINTNAKLDQLIALGTTDQTAFATGFLGDQIEATNSQAWVDSGGRATQIGYTLPGTAASVSIQIQNSAGTTVRTLTGNPTSKGHNVVTWDGKNDNGVVQPSGVYNVAVTALGTDGKPLSGVTQSIIGTVTGAAIDPTNGTQLSIGSITVPISAVTSIKKPS